MANTKQQTQQQQAYWLDALLALGTISDREKHLTTTAVVNNRLVQVPTRPRWAVQYKTATLFLAWESVVAPDEVSAIALVVAQKHAVSVRRVVAVLNVADFWKTAAKYGTANEVVAK